MFSSARFTRVFAGRLKVTVAADPSNPEKRSESSVELEAIPRDMLNGGKDWPMSQVIMVGTHWAKVPTDVI